MTTDTVDKLDVDTARDRAETAAADAQALRDRIAAGDTSVSAEQFTAAEQAERFARIQLAAAEARAAEDAERDATEQVERDRAEMQAAWAAAHAPAADAEVQALLTVAVEAAVAYLRAAQARTEELEELAARAKALGFRASAPLKRSPLPPLGKAILAEARRVLPVAHTTPLLDAPNDNVWGS